MVLTASGQASQSRQQFSKQMTPPTKQQMRKSTLRQAISYWYYTGELKLARPSNYVTTLMIPQHKRYSPRQVMLLSTFWFSPSTPVSAETNMCPTFLLSNQLTGDCSARNAASSKIWPAHPVTQCQWEAWMDELNILLNLLMRSWGSFLISWLSA